MSRWNSFSEYVQWRESQQPTGLGHKQALRWVLSALGIIDNADPDDRGQQDEITAALSSPLSSYPDKLRDLAGRPELQNHPNWPQIQAAIGNPDQTTVSKLVGLVTSAAHKAERPEDGQPYQEPTGDAPL